MGNFMINYEVVNEIEDMVYKTLGYFDEYTYSDALFIVEYALGMKENYKLNKYMYNILDKFGITEGCIHDEELICFIKNRRRELGDSEWSNSMIICELKKLLKK